MTIQELADIIYDKNIKGYVYDVNGMALFYIPHRTKHEDIMVHYLTGEDRSNVEYVRIPYENV